MKSPAAQSLTVSGEQGATVYVWNTGWNLTGVNGNSDTTVAAVVAFPLLTDNGKFSPSAKVISVWAWQGQGWAVNLPGEADKGEQYAKDNGLAFFTDLKHTQGFWTQVGVPGTAPAQPPDHPGASSTTTTITSGSTTTTTQPVTTTSTSLATSTTTTTQPGSTTIPLTSGWNLIGSRTPIPNVAQTFADTGKFVSVWKWLGTAGWAVFLAGEETPGAYANSKGFEPLTKIVPGDGFWVNAAQGGGVSLSGEMSVATSLPLNPGWNLKCLLSPDQVSLAAMLAQPKSVVSVWAWQGNSWAVYLTGEPEAGAYAKSKGFSQLATLSPDKGFWVNASDSADITLPLPPTTPPDLGAIQYTVDTTLQATTTYGHDGNPAVVTVTDGAGYVWTLTIPYGALLWPEKVTLTPFATLDTKGSKIKAMSGVRLEPDGLRFGKAGTLAVTPPAGTQAAGLLFSLKQNGTGVQFAPMTLDKGTVTAQIDHFSAVVYDPSQDGLDAYSKQAEEEYVWAVKEAKAFLSKGAPSPPTPPALCPYCRGTEANQDHGEYYEYEQAFMEPYQDINYVLLSAMRALQLVGSSVDTSEGWALATQIAELAWKSITEEGTKYAQMKPPEQLMVVLPVAIGVARQVELLGGEVAIGEVILLWAQTIRDYYFDQLKTQHDYRAWPLLISLERNFELLGGGDDNFLNKIMDALRFEVVWENTFSLSSYAQVTQKADLKPLEFKLEKGWWWGDITFDYTGGSYGGFPLAQAPSLTTELTMWNWDPCVTKTVDLVVWGGFGLVNEQYSGLDGVYGVAMSAGLEAYKLLHVEGNPAGYMFTVPIQNNNATLGDQDFSGSGLAGAASAQSHIKVIHTP